MMRELQSFILSQLINMRLIIGGCITHMSSSVSSWASSCWFLLAKRIMIQMCYKVASSLIVYFQFKVLTLCWKERRKRERQTIPSPRVLFSRSCFAWSLVMRLLPSRYSRNFCDKTQLRPAWVQKYLTAGWFKHRTRIIFLAYLPMASELGKFTSHKYLLPAIKRICFSPLKITN